MSQYDVVVLGAGAAGLTAALSARGHGASVAVLEKADKLGGTSAWSGGMIWIPNNDHMKRHGIEDSREDAIQYLMSMSHGLMDERLVASFVDHGAEMVRWLEQNTSVEFQLVPEFPDYHPEFPGGKPGGGRSLECPLFSFDRLGDHRDRVTVGANYGKAPITMEESTLGKAVPLQVSAEEHARRAASDERGCGQSLIGHLFHACLEKGIEIHTECQATELITREGIVRGAKIKRAGQEQIVHANGGIVLATGGFEWNKELVRSFLRGPLTSPVSIPTNEGDGLIMCMRIGAALGNMREAWWMPAVETPNANGSIQTHLFAAERARPRSIIVNKAGKRFTNEAANYNAFGAAFHEQDVAHFSYPNLPCWFVFDQEHLDRFGYLQEPPGSPAPNWMARGSSLRELAENIGADAQGLKATVERWNRHVDKGRDPDFHRGESVHDTWWGDPNNKGKPEATLGRIDRAPFYALEVKSGALGTKGGPKTDALGRVINVDGEVIAGLYAAGNVMASVMGMTYGGAGGTLAPGMVFGYLGGKDAAARAKRE